MRKMANAGKWLAALLLVLIFLPCVGLALGDYVDDVMDEYCDSWTEYYKQNGPKIDLSATLSILAWSHGDYDMYSKGKLHTAVQMLTSQKSPATFFVEAEASFDDEEYTIMMVDEYLTETPTGLKITANGQTLVGKYEQGTVDENFHYFEYAFRQLSEAKQKPTRYAGGDKRLYK